MNEVAMSDMIGKDTEPTFEVWANNVEFCESKSNSAPMQNTQPVSRPTDNGDFSEMPSDEDLPF